ncbi:iron complex outermembrane receptor protein [Pseudomonas duriflava]|uniref:Iron complex outermembrane receptor protein n=1 Tax=Pseudomonas duriflava TaxID=459528 RepID=A0A562QIX8_9PSED|nr:TonB-dependent siderophore receptor [Pseudomonas duriflava]TWI56689.1 iron complex outermembrane receptor protein [Pseudomonas duriflava]
MPSLFRPTLLATALVLGHAAFVHAQTAVGERNYQLPTAPLSTTLTRIASDAGLTLSLDPGLASGRTSHPVNGRYDATEALREALRDTGLELVESEPGIYTLRPLPSADDTLSMATTTIMAGPMENAWGPAEGYVANRTASATKTDTPILETARSLSVATRDQMTDRAVHNIDDAVRYMPGAVSSFYGSDTRADWLRVRGFEPTRFLDGLRLPDGVYVDPKPETWNLERLTLLRGPASSVYGQTPPGGLIEMVSLRPQAEASHEVRVEAGNYNHRQINFDTTGALDDEARFLYRVSGVVRDSDTQIEHVPDKRYNIAPSLTWNINDDTHLTFLSQYTRDDTGITSQFLPLRGTKLEGPWGEVSRHKNLGDPDWEFYDRTYYSLGYAFDHRFNETWQFRQNLRYTKSDLSFQGITVGGYAEAVSEDGTVARNTNIVDEDISQFAVDNNLQGNFSTGEVQHTLLLGLDYQRSNTNYQYLFGQAPSSNINNPVYGQYFDPAAARQYTLYDYNQKTHQTGLYIQDQMALDHWRLTLGGRKDWVTTETEFYTTDAHPKRDDSAFTGNASLSYVFDSGLVPYISYSESFQPTSGADVSATQSFKPTEGKQYEVGVKYQPTGTNTLLTAAVYDLTQKNVSVTDNVGGVTITSQTGKVKVRGVELEATSHLTDNLKLIASYAYTDTEVQDGQYKGNRLQLIPEHQASLWADYTWHAGSLDGFGVAGGVRYVGDTYGDQANTWLGHTGSNTIYDAAAHYDLSRLDSRFEGASVGVNVTNLFNKEYLSTCDGYYCYYGDERSVVANVTYKW